MARAKVVHSADAAAIFFKGDERKPEPSTGAINFPGGYVEVSRTRDGKYWAHISVDRACNVVQSRVDYDYDGYVKVVDKIPDIPEAEHIIHLAIMIDGPYHSTETL